MITIPLGIGRGGRVAAILGPYANRHGLIAGATGTGKTFTLATLAEGFSRAGVPVFISDVKGDLAGLARAGRGDPAPVRFLDVYAQEGDAIRVRLADFGPELLARVLALSPVQGEVLDGIMAAPGLASLGDLARRLAIPRHEFRATKASLDSIARAVMNFRRDGADLLFGAPTFELADLEARRDGRGVVSILASERLIRSPDLYGALLLWILGSLYDRAPEIGDVAAPRLVLIFDEAHLLFRDAAPVLIRRIEQTVRLIRSKGIGVYFASQSPADIPATIAAQLSNRVQHAMRAATLADRREIQGAADCLPSNPAIRTADLIATMPTGTALVSTLDASGRPTPVDVVRIDPPAGALGPMSAAERLPYRRAPGAAAGALERAPASSSPRWRVALGGAILTALAAVLHGPMVLLAAIALASLALAIVRA